MERAAVAGHYKQTQLDDLQQRQQQPQQPAQQQGCQGPSQEHSTTMAVSSKTQVDAAQLESAAQLETAAVAEGQTTAASAPTAAVAPAAAGKLPVAPAAQAGACQHPAPPRDVKPAARRRLPAALLAGAVTSTGASASEGENLPPLVYRGPVRYLCIPHDIEAACQQVLATPGLEAVGWDIEWTVTFQVHACLQATAPALAPRCACSSPGTAAHATAADAPPFHARARVPRSACRRGRWR